MEGLLAGLALAVIIHFVRNHYAQKEHEKSVEEVIKEGRKEMAEKVRNRKVREDLNEFSEEEFWNLIDKARSRSGENYKHHLGLLSDWLFKLSTDEILHIDNLITRLYEERISHELQAATYIIFKSADIHSIHVLMTVFLLRGQAFFNQACMNPNLIIGKDVTDIDGRTLFDITADVYFRQTDELIPIPEEKDEQVELRGEKWTEQELPTKFSELWMHFA